MPHPEISNLFCCFLVWRLANYICRRSYKRPLENNLYFFIHFLTAPYAVFEAKRFKLFIYAGLMLSSAFPFRLE